MEKLPRNRRGILRAVDEWRIGYERDGCVVMQSNTITTITATVKWIAADPDCIVNHLAF